MIDRLRLTSESIKRGYTDEEVGNLYELGRMFLEHGFPKKALAIFKGLNEIAPDFACAWLGTGYVAFLDKQFEIASTALRQVLRVDPQMIEGVLLLAICMLSIGDTHAAGTYLGEVRERIESGSVKDPDVIRIYKSQLIRYNWARG